MTTIFGSLYVLPLLFICSYAGPAKTNPFKEFNQQQILGPHERFGNPFGNPNDYKAQKVPDDFGTLPLNDNDKNPNNEEQNDPAPVGEPNHQDNLRGTWELASDNSGVSSMHAILLPKTNKVLMYDATIWRISALKLPNGECWVFNQTTGEKDCWCHSVLFDTETAELKPLELHTDTWCSSGGLSVDGNLIGTGGFEGGANTVRYLETCDTCAWREFPTALAEPRWYSTQVQLPDGAFMVFGGRNAFSYEYIPQEGQSNDKAIFFDFLKQTSDKDENNLYPFVHLSTDGNVFIFANDRAVLLDPKSGNVVRKYPPLPGGHRNYPATGMSVLLPIKLNSKGGSVIPAEVLICGGSAHADSYTKAGENIFYTALKDCGRMKITDNVPIWRRDLMPSPRIMGDMIILPTGDVLMLNGAQRGCSGWGFAREPNFKPVLYNFRATKGERFRELDPTTIPRMYHSTATLIPDGKVLVAGSNSNNGYIYDAMYPTELRVEKFSPPYLDKSVANARPNILNVAEKISYDQKFQIQVDLVAAKVSRKEILVTMYAPAFTTHGVSMNQRLIFLAKTDVKNKDKTYDITASAPPSGKVAPPGYYMLFVVSKGIPSVAKWVQIQ